MDSFSDLLSFAFEGPHRFDQHRPLYIEAEDAFRCLNAVQLRKLVCSLIAGLKAAGLQKGDSVLCSLANNIFYSAIYFAIIGAGGIYAGINPANRAFELEHYLELVRPKYIITSKDVLPKILPSASSKGTRLDHIYVIDAESFPIASDKELPSSPQSPSACSDTDICTAHNLTELLRHGQSDWIRFSDEATAKSTPAAMYSTSGTSGLPKAAIISHHALVCQHLSIEPTPPYEVRRLVSLPFFHIFAALFVHILPVRNGQPLYVLPRFHLQQYVESISKFGITDTLMAPPMVHALNNSTLPLSEMLHTVRYIGVGGAPIDALAMQKFQDKLHSEATLSQVWGMTEIGAAMLHQYPHHGHLGSVGKPLPGYEMRLVDAFGNLIAANHEPGDLQVRYAGMMTGYKNQAPIPEGSWYSTGDIMSRISGRYYIVGRSKELIKVNGFQVAPAELEATLLTHPCITDAAVIGRLRADGVTEVPRAFVIRKSDDGRCSSLTAEEVYNYIAERLASYKRLDGGVVFVAEIPRTASGKIQRFKLAEMDRFRNSITDLLVRNDHTVKVEDVRRLRTRSATRRRSTRIGRQATDQVTSAVPIMAKPKRQRKTSLRAKMKALRESSMSVYGTQPDIAFVDSQASIAVATA